MSASNLGGIFVLLSFSVFQCFAFNDLPPHPACAGLLQISPSRLVVRYGDPASALCTITQDATEPDLFSWELAMLHTLIPGPRNKTLKVDKVDQWDTAPQCYSTFLVKSEEIPCNTQLNVIVYQPPDSIQLLAEMEGDMVEGREYTVNCSIENVAPIQKLKVRFYRGDTLLATQVHPDTTELKPQSAHFLLPVTARGEDDGSEMWCEASLDLEHTPVNKSAGVRTSVLYRPRIQTTHHSKQPVNITEGDTLELNCTARANPTPNYSWTLPQGVGNALNTDILILPHVKHTGNYTCNVWNSQGTDAITYLVEVKVDWLPIIAGLVGAVIFVVIVIGCFILKAHYNQTRTGRYDLRNIFQSLKGASNHVALSNGSLL